MNFKRSCESSEERESLRAEIVSLLTSEYKQAMLNSSQGMPFIQNRTDIPMNCFISAEAVWWCMEHIEDVACEADAIVFMQVMADFDLVRHISDHHQMESSIGEIKIFIHGFYLYYIISQEASHHVFTKVGLSNNIMFTKPISKVRISQFLLSLYIYPFSIIAYFVGVVRFIAYLSIYVIFVVTVSSFFFCWFWITLLYPNLLLNVVHIPAFGCFLVF